jgi:ubiquinone/menaquinone biosynthesis C-methylase UbiE
VTTHDPNNQHEVADDWDVYWTGTHENAAHKEGGAQDVVLARFWSEFFGSNLGGDEPQRLLDLACGNGAVVGFALQVAPQTITTCLDYSVSAVMELRKRYPEVSCIAGDAQHTPFSQGSFDIVASQFGIEYAGIDAIDEAACLVAPQGSLAVIAHLRDGAIYAECSMSLRAIEAVWESKIFPLARDAFNAGFALNAGTGSVKKFKSADKRMAPAIRSLEGILREMGSDVAAGLVQQVYRDIAHMYQRMSAFDKAEVIGWIDGMVRELDAYRGRMSSMLAAAMDAEEIQRMAGRTVAGGLTVSQCLTLEMGAEPEPAAWVLVCKRV